jgi:hypothetical protein
MLMPWITRPAAGQQRTSPVPGTRRAVAVDGKTLRGSGIADGPGRHLLAALDHGHARVARTFDAEYVALT